MELNDLYRDVILDHNRRPRNFGVLTPADASVEGYNPLCGDRLTVQVRMAGRIFPTFDSRDKVALSRQLRRR